MYKFHYDAGHGWLEVPVTDLHQLGVASKISQYSYQADGKAYLEEDCDYTVFMEAYREKFGGLPGVVDVDDGDDSYIRRLPRYS